MYYKVKVYSAEDSTKRNDFFVKETLPYVNREVLEEFFQKATPYQVKVIPLPHVTQLKKKYKAWDSMDLERHIKDIRFYTLKEHEVEDYFPYATFYKEKPFDIENDFFNGQWYSFFKRPGKYTTDIWTTLVEILYGICPEPHISKNGDPFVADKYILTNDGFGHWNLCRLVGTHKELVRERLCC